MDEMDKALAADREKLIALGADPGPTLDDLDLKPWVDCWNCNEGYVASCFEDYACVDPEGGCDDCLRKCSICGGMGGWHATDGALIAQDALAQETQG
jgi:hypothetical protein